VYDKASEDIEVDAPFKASLDKNEIVGSRLQYNIETETMYAENIHATVVMVRNASVKEGERSEGI
jgi:hypothetical protein